RRADRLPPLRPGSGRGRRQGRVDPGRRRSRRRTVARRPRAGGTPAARRRRGPRGRPGRAARAGGLMPAAGLDRLEARSEVCGDCDGRETRYEVFGDGPPLLLFSPGGFNATVENWSTFGIYARLDLLEHLTPHFTCIAFDKRESGQSGGRVERLTWNHYARQGAELLDHLGIDRARLMGGCIGCSVALAFADAWPQRAERLLLYSPAGGPRYRLTQHARFDEHAAFVRTEGLDELVDLARTSDRTFAQDPRLGPWASVVTAGLDV